MLEVRSANEYALYQDRTALIIALSLSNAALEKFGGKSVPLPPFYGLHVASPDLYEEEPHASDAVPEKS
jgi:hypothetical protein